MYKLALGITFGLLLFNNTAMATCSSYPYTLTNGTTADATQVMADLNCAALTSGATMNSTSFTGNSVITSSSVSFSPLVINNHSSAIGIEFREDAGAYMKQYFYEHTGATANVFLAGEGTSYFMNSVGIGTSTTVDTLQVGDFTGGHVLEIGAGAAGYSSLYFGHGTGANRYDGYLQYNHANNSMILGTSQVDRLWVDSSGKVGIATSSPSYTLHVNGSVAGTSAYNNLSDARLKKNIVPLTSGLALIGQLQPVRFDWRSESEREVGKEFTLPASRQIGFIAQDVGKVLPEAVSTAKGKDAIMSIAESKIVPVLVTAVKELKAANDNQAAEIGRLEGQVAALQRKMDKQTAQR